STALIQPRFSASRFWSLALRHRATISAHVPFTFKVLGAQEGPAEHHFRQWIVPRHMPDLAKRFSIPVLMPAWGMTEMVAQPILGDPFLPVAAGAIGRPS